jgi:mono/diheme cytochrome c family protein
VIVKSPAFAIGVALTLVTGAGLVAQERGGRGNGGSETLAKGTDITSSRNFDMAAVDRGKAKFAMLCASCHGEDARGGSGKTDVDLVRSVLVLDDVGGRELGAFLKTGRPARKMPAFTLTPEEVSDIAAFLHHNVTAASERGAYRHLDVLVGSAKAGEAYFNGAGGCAKCHSVSGDLKGIGSKYDPPDIQLRVVTGGGGGRGSANNPATAKKAAITLPDGKVVSGALTRITPFSVTVRDASGAPRTFERDGDNPKVVVTDPLQAHLDLMRRYTDEQMHDLTAYLATLK